jgi:glycopeptide antibiotics resistance protein
LRYYFKKSFKQTVLLTFCLSLFFELTQLTGLYFIYPRSYRLFDVNDLLHNTLGGILGYFITPIFTFLLPTREEIDERSYAKGTEVTYIRRGVAWGIDWLFIGFLMTLITIVLRLFTNDYTITLDNHLIVYSYNW